MNADYERYIRSDHWARTRAGYFQRNVRTCRICGTTGKIVLHHLHYKSLGRETDTDLIPLCQDCHTKIHKFARNTRKGSLKGKSLRFIRESEREERRLALFRSPASARQQSRGG